MENLFAVILCGGYGNRLWPLSSKHLPKQFIKLADNKSLFQLTLLRIEKLKQNFKQTIIVGNDEHRFTIHEQIKEINFKLNFILILEPKSLNTAPAISLAALYLNEHYIKSRMVIFSSDHFYGNEIKFKENISRALTHKIKENELILFGVLPNEPNPNYGYFEVEKKNKFPKKIINFYEKPSKQKCKNFYSNKNFYWNSGIFIIPSDTWLNSIKKVDINFYEIVSKSWVLRSTDMKFIRPDSNLFSNLMKISIDYLIIENFKKIKLSIYAYIFDCAWTDLGSFDKIKNFYDTNPLNNVSNSSVYFHNSKNNFALTSNKNIYLSEVNNLIVIDTPDAILVANLKKPSSIINLYNKISNKDPGLLENHYKEYRPWGYFQIIAEGKNFKVKKIFIKPSGQLSLQSHKFRNEHWVVVRGIASIKIDNKNILLNINESLFIKKNQKHQLANLSTKPLEIIEVQTGTLLDESDIIRYKDVYRRD